ncbi:MAG: two-component regulator propeller domain-containing protein, partial [Bacteroidota bacterium]
MRTQLTALILVFAMVAEAQDFRNFRALGLVDGMTSNTVNAILQDSDGYLWIGTEDGLNRYDASSFIPYRKGEDSLTIHSNTVLAVFEDEDQTVWVGTNAGVAYYNKAVGTFNRLAGTENTSVRDFVQAAKDRLWLATENKGVLELDLLTRKLRPILSNAMGEVATWSLDRDSKGYLWIGTVGQGLFRSSPDGAQVEHIIQQGAVRDIYSTANITYVGTEEYGLRAFDGLGYDIELPASLSSIRVWSIGHNNEEVWVGTDGNGLYVLHPDGKVENHVSNNQKPSSLSVNVIRAITNDRDGGMWLGTYLGGVNYFHPENSVFGHYENDLHDERTLSHNIVLSFEENHRGLWVGTDGGGVNCFDGQKFRRYTADSHDLSGNVILCLQDSKEGLWMGTYQGGLNLYRNGTFTSFQNDPNDPTSLSNNSVWALEVDRQGRLWVGTNGGDLDVYDEATGTFEHHKVDTDDPTKLQSNNIRALFRDAEDYMWVGTFQGLHRYDHTQGTFSNYRAKSGATDMVMSIAQDREGMLWIGTYGGGFARFDPSTEEFRTFGEDEGLSSNIVFGVVVDDTTGYIWLSTSKGLARFDPEQGQLVNYSILTGLQNDAYNVGAYFQSEDGHLYFGGNKGFTAFEPSSISTSEDRPAVVITDMQVNNKPVTVGAEDSPLKKHISQTHEVQLRHDQNILDLGFSALSYISPANIEYAYRMRDFEEDWNEVGNRRHAIYTNLDPGSYTFEVKATNHDGVWNHDATALQISILPPWWATWWFRLLSILTLVGGATVAIRQRARATRRREAVLRERVQEATSEVKMQNAALNTQQEHLRSALNETTFAVQQVLEHGNFSARIDTSQKRGEWLELAQRMNELFETVQAPIGELNHIAGQIAEGDWTARYTRQAKGDILKLSHNLNTALDAQVALMLDIVQEITIISAVTSEMLDTTKEMNVGTEEISSSISEMSHGAATQLSNIDQSSNKLEGILTTSNKIGGQAAAIQAIADQGNQKSTDGEQQVQDLDKDILATLRLSKASHEAISALSQRSESISGVIRFIKEIAAQTNL